MDVPAPSPSAGPIVAADQGQLEARTVLQATPDRALGSIDGILVIVPLLRASPSSRPLPFFFGFALPNADSIDRLASNAGLVNVNPVPFALFFSRGRKFGENWIASA